MDSEAATFFLDQLRHARACALQDAEGFQEVLFVLERMGAYLSGGAMGLGKFKKYICEVARKSPLAYEIPSQHVGWHSNFSTLYELVRVARNDALHQGAFARHLTSNVVQLALILEDALMSKAETVGEFMVREPVCATLWQPLSFIRLQMLKNSFTYLPIFGAGKEDPCWHFVSDYHVANYLRSGDKTARLAMPLKSAIEDGLQLDPANICFASTSVLEALDISRGKPVIVVDKDNHERMIGIVTPFDLL